MMSSENIPPTPAPENHTPGNRKRSSAPRADQEQPVTCPRCDSSNTKFCYYNNYSLAQPRYFCKTCRRYWTKGGALRNVPVGGGCRKAKKIKSSSSSAASRLLSCGGDTEAFGEPAIEFQLGGLSLPRLHPATAGVYTQFINRAGSGSGFGLDMLGLNYQIPSTKTTSSPTSSVVVQGGDHRPISLSSIESLSSINQEMHWKLQQQRLALIYAGDNNNNNNENNDDNHSQIQNHKVMSTDSPTECEWLFDQSSYIPRTTTTSSCNNSTNWSDFHQFNGLQ